MQWEEPQVFAADIRDSSRAFREHGPASGTGSAAGSYSAGRPGLIMERVNRD